jgi:hypothetical protein
MRGAFFMVCLHFSHLSAPDIGAKSCRERIPKRAHCHLINKGKVKVLHTIYYVFCPLQAAHWGVHPVVIVVPAACCGILQYCLERLDANCA